MENDTVLKHLLDRAAAKAPADFTAKIMSSLPATAPGPFVYKPLIPAVLQKIFLLFFLAIIVSIIAVSIWIALGGYHFNIIERLPVIPVETVQKTFTAIVVFWLVFVANRLLQRGGLNRVSG